MRSTINTAFDLNTQALVNVSTGTTTGVVTPNYVKNNEVLLKIQIYDTYPAFANLASMVTFEAGVGPVGGTAAPLIQTTNASFQTDAWANASGGKLTAIINSHSVALSVDLSTNYSKQYKQEIRGNDGLDNVTIVLMPVYATNTVYST